jgi:hypothetical protein
MGGRFLVTGVQLGMLVGLDTLLERSRLVEDIVSIQYVKENKGNNVVESCIIINELLEKK